jgi:hypothetical protein
MKKIKITVLCCVHENNGHDYVCVNGRRIYLSQLRKRYNSSDNVLAKNNAKMIGSSAGQKMCKSALANAITSILSK